MLAWHLFCGKLWSLNGGSIEGRLLMLRWRGEEYSLADVPSKVRCMCVCVCVCVCQYKHVFEHVCCGMCEITDSEDPWGNPLHERFILQAGKLWRKHFIPLKLQALNSERLIDSSVEAELTPSFRLNALPLRGSISPSRLWLNLMLEFVHTSRALLLYKCCFYLRDVLPRR